MYLCRNFHFDLLKITNYLKRWHDIEISISGVWRLFGCLGMERLLVNWRYKRQILRWRRYEKPHPGIRCRST